MLYRWNTEILSVPLCCSRFVGSGPSLVLSFSFFPLCSLLLPLSSQLGTMHASFCVVCFHGDGRWICRQLRCFSSFSSTPSPGISSSSSSSSSFFVRGVSALSLLLSATSSSPYASRLLFFLPRRRGLSVRAQPLAYNETENLRGTRRMRRMITYIETKNRPARRRRSAARSLSSSVSLPL